MFERFVGGGLLAGALLMLSDTASAQSWRYSPPAKSAKPAASPATAPVAPAPAYAPQYSAYAPPPYAPANTGPAAYAPAYSPPPTAFAPPAAYSGAAYSPYAPAPYAPAPYTLAAAPPQVPATEIQSLPPTAAEPILAGPQGYPPALASNGTLPAPVGSPNVAPHAANGYLPTTAAAPAPAYAPTAATPIPAGPATNAAPPATVAPRSRWPGFRLASEGEVAQPVPAGADGKAFGEEFCDDACGPSACWVLGAELLGLTRSSANRQTLVYDCEDLCSAIDARDIDFGHELGLRTTIARLPGACGGCAWEITYMGLPNWSSTATHEGFSILNGPGFTLEVDPALFVVQYESSLHSLELNARPCQAVVCGAACSWFVGFRYLRLDENLRVDELVVPVPGALDVDTANNLYGGQFGANLLLMDHGGPFYLESTLKVGLFGNDASQDTSSSLLGPAVSADDVEIAMVGEFLFTAGYRVNSCFDLRVGYQVLGVQGVALAPDQLAATDLAVGAANVEFGALVVHGAFLGGSFRW